MFKSVLRLIKFEQCYARFGLGVFLKNTLVNEFGVLNIEQRKYTIPQRVMFEFNDTNELLCY